MEYKMNIEIITTPNQKLKETGFGCYLSCLDILDSLQRTTHTIRLTICESLSDLEGVLKRKPELLFLAAKYLSLKNEKKLWFTEFFENTGIICAGSKFETLQFDSNKAKAKNLVSTKGIKTAKHFVAWPEQYQYEETLPLNFPLFVKPIDAANSCGIDDDSYVNSFSAYENKVQAIYNKFNEPALVEEYLGGREFTVAITCDHKRNLVVAPIEVLPPESNTGLRILGQSVKEHDTEYLQKISVKAEHLSVCKLAVSAFLALGVRGYGRIDIKMDDNGDYYFMEANLVPGMCQSSSYFPRAFEITHNMTFDDVIYAMLDESLSRVNNTPECQINRHWPIALPENS